MSQVEQVALWLGLFAGIVSVTLAIVSIVFTLHVDRRSSDVNDKAIKSLENIQTTGTATQGIVAELSNRVIDRLFGMAERAHNQSPAGQEVASGLTTELKHSLEKELDLDRIPYLEDMILRLKDDVQDLLLDSSFGDDSDAAFQHAVAQLQRCSPEAQELARRLSRGRHLTEEEFLRLLHPSTGGFAGELRANGLLVPLAAEWTSQELVYWFLPNMAPVVEAAVGVLPPPEPSVRSKVSKLLEHVGYTESDPES